MRDRGSRAPPWKHSSDSLHTNTHKPVPITDVTYVDDEAIFITGADNDELVANIKKVANTVDKTMSAHGMAVSWDQARPRSSYYGPASAPEHVSTNAKLMEYLGSCWKMDACAGLYRSTNTWGPWSLRPRPVRWKLEKGSKRPLVPFMLSPGKYFCSMRSTSNYDPVCSMRLSCLFCCTTPRLGCPLEYRYVGYTFATSDAYEEWANTPEHPFQARYVSPTRKC